MGDYIGFAITVGLFLIPGFLGWRMSRILLGRKGEGRDWVVVTYSIGMEGSISNMCILLVNH